MDPIQLSIKIPKPFFTKLEKHNVIFLWKQRRIYTNQSILRKKNKAGAIMLSGFKLCYKATVIKTGW